MTKTPTWISWDSMIQRCTNPRHKSFADYGGRGIVICDDWWDFGRFLADMGERPKGTTLDRYPDLNGNYEPDNCRWATGKQQGNNRRSNVVLEFDGKKQTVAEWALELGIGPKTIGYRLRNGWTLEEALTMKVGHGNGWARGSR
jgi:hypothetical protein